MAVTLTAQGIQHSGGTFGNSSQGQTSTPFMYHYIDSNNYNFSGSWVNFMQTPDWQVPPKTQGICYWYLPVRNDQSSWGGARVRTYIRINQGSWQDQGDSGYAQNDNTMSQPNSGRIDHQCQSQQYDFSNETSNFTVSFRFDIQHHNGDGWVNNSCDVDGGGNMNGDGYGGQHNAIGDWSNQGGSTGYSHCAWMGQGYE